MNDERFLPSRRRLGLAALAVAFLGARAIAAPPSVAHNIVAAARSQIGDVYDAAYVRLAYPNGDVARGRGACTDVVIRALRQVGHDLQREVYADRRRHGIARPDRSIDQRRVRNLRVFFARHAQTLTRQVTPQTLAAGAWRAGDIVCWKLPGGLDHIGIVSDRKNAAGSVPLVIHNIGPACREEGCLTAWPITDHFRYP